ncbi:MAG: hypothetical protein Athens071416_454 [Parcubacteria group bacterium Athens0714_16]|nr:MAG: hypothetical protein Athens071416_454 [Parcubacteria group bacterium Athens0714_16]
MNILSVVGLIIAIASAVLAVYSFVNTKQKIHFIWGLFSTSVALWGLGIFKFASSVELENSVFWWRIGEIGVIFIPIFLTHFVYEFLNRKKKNIIYILYFISSIFLFFNIFTDYFFGPVRFIFDQFYYITPTPVYTVMVVLFLLLAFYNILILYKELNNSKDPVVKHQIQYLIAAFIVGFAGGATSFFPVYGIYVYPVYNITILISALVVVYSIFKYQLLNIKVLATQLLVFSIWFFLFGRILLASNIQDKIIEIILLSIMIILGILLIKSVLKEISTRERIEKLAKDLEDANVKLKELDRQKSEFLSIASHQFRSPLSAIKGYTSLILEGSYGKIDEKIKQPIKNVFDSTNNLALIVDDFLNVSRIEQGRMEYKFENAKVNEIIESVINEMKPSIDESGLEFSFNYDKNEKFDANIDTSKFRQVIINLIDNALKYTKKGWLKIELNKNKEGKILFKLSDSGVGIPKQELPNLFTLFKRAGNANKVNVKGTGLGLYIVKKIMEAHNGRVWAESDGEGKGAEFYVELDSKKQ